MGASIFWSCSSSGDNDCELKNLGGTVTVPATPVQDFGRFAVVQDPMGVHIAFWQSLKSK